MDDPDTAPDILEAQLEHERSMRTRLLLQRRLRGNDLKSGPAWRALSEALRAALDAEKRALLALEQAVEGSL